MNPSALVLPVLAVLASAGLPVSAASPDASAPNQPTQSPESQASTTAAPQAPAPAQPAVPAPGQVRRVAGDMNVAVTFADGVYTSGECRIDTPLPVGYPAPTPPGAIEVKTYPSVRRAEITGSGNPRMGMNRAFFPLFNHIQRHNIEMTAPVEMDYVANEQGERSWTMSFLYRVPELRDTGKDGSISIVDTEPVTVLAIGVQGSIRGQAIDQAEDELERFIAASDEWERVDRTWVRTMGYNGPDVRVSRQWTEVQMKVRPRASTPAEPPADAPSAPAADQAQPAPASR